MPVTFQPPNGYRVRILRLRGDLVSWPKVLPGDTPVTPGQYAGVLLGFQTTSPGGSGQCDYCADNTMLYIQDAISTEPHRAPFDYTNVDMLLNPDNELLVKIASWLNTTGKPIHVEATFTVTYRYEKVNN